MGRRERLPRALPFRPVPVHLPQPGLLDAGGLRGAADPAVQQSTIGPRSPDARTRSRPGRRSGKAERAPAAGQYRDPQACRGPGAADPRAGKTEHDNARGPRRGGCTAPWPERRARAWDQTALTQGSRVWYKRPVRSHLVRTTAALTIAV